MKKLLLVTMLFGFLVSCRSLPNIETQFATMTYDRLVQTTTKEKFDDVSDVIRHLEVGSDISLSGIEWKVDAISAGDKPYGIISSSDGWLPFLSGGWVGALSKLGQPVGIDGNKVIGNHVFGYSWGGMNAVPRIIVVTEAEIISTDSLDSTDQRSWVNNPSSGEKVYFERAYIKKIIELQDPKLDLHQLTETINKGQGEEISEGRLVDDYISVDSYEIFQQQVRSLEVGMPMIQVISMLKGKVFMLAQDKKYAVWGIHGFLNITDQIHKPIKTKEGLYIVWPFGYKNGSEDVIQSVLVFKNGEFMAHLKNGLYDGVGRLIEDYETSQKLSSK